jgi:hypothetical protein
MKIFSMVASEERETNILSAKANQPGEEQTKEGLSGSQRYTHTMLLVHNAPVSKAVEGKDIDFDTIFQYFSMFNMELIVKQ